MDIQIQNAEKPTPALFELLQRICEPSVAFILRSPVFTDPDTRTERPGFLTGIYAMMMHLEPGSLLYFMRETAGKDTLNFELRMHTSHTQKVAAELARNLNLEMNRSCLIYMVEVMIRKLPQPLAVLNSNGTVPDIIFIVEEDDDPQTLYVCMQVHMADDPNNNLAIRVASVVGLDDERYALQVQQTSFRKCLGPGLPIRVVSRELMLSEMRDNIDGCRLLENTLSDYAVVTRSKKNDVEDETNKSLFLEEMSKIHLVRLSEVLVDLNFPGKVCEEKTPLRNVVFAYSDNSSEFSRECVVAHVNSKPPAGDFRKIEHVLDSTVPNSKIKTAIHCAAMNAGHAISRSELSPLDNFTVYRGVDYFQIEGQGSIWTSKPPFFIHNCTPCSASLDERQAERFIKGLCGILVLNVPSSYQKFIAMGQGLSEHTEELEILFPDDVRFQIDERTMHIGKTGTLVLKLIGRVLDGEKLPLDRPSCGGNLACPKMSGGLSSSRFSQPRFSSSRFIPHPASRHFVPALRPNSPSVLHLIDLSSMRSRSETRFDVFGFGDKQNDHLKNVFKSILKIHLLSNIPNASNASNVTQGGGRIRRKKKSPLKIDLARKAASLGIKRISRMRKDELIKAIKKHQRSKKAHVLV